MVDRGKEGIGAVVDRCSGMRQALCLTGKGDFWRRGCWMDGDL